jgi:hypothetical protein
MESHGIVHARTAAMNARTAAASASLMRCSCNKQNRCTHISIRQEVRGAQVKRQ